MEGKESKYPMMLVGKHEIAICYILKSRFLLSDDSNT